MVLTTYVCVCVLRFLVCVSETGKAWIQLTKILYMEVRSIYNFVDSEGFGLQTLTSSLVGKIRLFLVVFETTSKVVLKPVSIVIIYVQKLLEADWPKDSALF